MLKSVKNFCVYMFLSARMYLKNRQLLKNINFEIDKINKNKFKYYEDVTKSDLLCRLNELQVDLHSFKLNYVKRSTSDVLGGYDINIEVGGRNLSDCGVLVQGVDISISSKDFIPKVTLHTVTLPNDFVSSKEPTRNEKPEQVVDKNSVHKGEV